ncbi:MAG: tryptophan--tRNA ligase [Alphaproteobacteria bacterium]|nr:tryptophan--tRNA ligase [Alphaproteobacteria bacterium]NCQ66908.1 tryptophan--tRNA ligase [Alphaproteobacteria bacterium]NCT07476.1 tryptophan--tRNA ligase [Alphaproteobacteria bacterium]
MTGRILSGVQPTNNLTIGNYLGAIKNWVDLQSRYETLFCIVDLHAVTVPQDPKALHQATLEVAAAYLAAGIDPKESTVFVQSHVHAHAELGWLLSCMTPLGWLNRMTQFKDKAGKKRDNAALGLLAYPTLMAADILLYQTTHVPVGDDQKQHIELTRDIALSFNHRFQKDIFTVPEPLIKGEAKRIMSLRDGSKKMSKSDPSDFSRIHLTDTADEISQKIRKAKTDPEPLPETSDGFEGRPEAKNLVTVYAAFTDQTLEEALPSVAGKSFSEFKPLLADLLIDKLLPISKKTARYLDEKAELEKILKRGAEHASTLANQTLKQVKDVMGFVSPF